jgi:hypothetical protein
VRQVHAAQSIGRQIVTQRRIQRQQKPNRPTPGANPPRQPGLQKQNGLPQRPGSPPPGLPNRPGQPQQLQPQPKQPPGLQRQPNVPGAPGVQRPGLQNRPALLPPRRPAAPRGKPQKQKR